VDILVPDEIRPHPPALRSSVHQAPTTRALGGKPGLPRPGQGGAALGLYVRGSHCDFTSLPLPGASVPSPHRCWGAASGWRCWLKRRTAWASRHSPSSARRACCGATCGETRRRAGCNVDVLRWCKSGNVCRAAWLGKRTICWHPLPITLPSLARRWQNARMGLVITAVVLVAAYALVAVICSPTFKC